MKVTIGLSEAHRVALNHAYAGTMTASDLALLADIAGAVNQAFATATVPPTPDPADPLARMRLAPGQLSMWANATSPELEAMRLIHGRDRVSQQVGFYGPGMPGNVGVRQTGPSTYQFFNSLGGWTPDVGGAGDTQVAVYAAVSGIPVIGALTP